MKNFLGTTLAIFLLTSVAWSESFVSGLETGVCRTFEFALGDVNRHEMGNTGPSLNLSYPFLRGFSQNSILSAVGLTLDASILIPIQPRNYIDSWWITDFAFGAYVDLKINDLITLRPKILADTRVNIVESEERNVHGAYIDFGGKAGIDCLFDFFKNGLILKAGGGYMISPEKNRMSGYISMNAGLTYRFE